MQIAQAHIFLSIATILATLNIEKGKDASGNIIEPEIVNQDNAIR